MKTAVKKLFERSEQVVKDALRCAAHVAWTASYAREGEPDVTIDFDVNHDRCCRPSSLTSQYLRQ